MFSGLSIATSGIRAAQRHLAITGHNMANAEIPGYSRQRMIQKTAFTRTIGTNGAGDQMMLGMGTDWNAVHQIRNEFLDLTYRENMGRLSFYSMKVQVGLVVEGLLGELHGAYSFQSVLNDMWFTIQELSSPAGGIEARALFLSTAQAFLNKAQHVYRGLLEYQHNLDDQIRNMVGEINSTIARVEQLNVLIRTSEAVGDNANDFRDERNRLLDRLSEMIPLDTATAANGDIIIFSQGRTMLNNGIQNTLGLRRIHSDFNFVEPVFTTEVNVLPPDSDPTRFVAWTNYNRPIGSPHGTNAGQLNALLAARGVSGGNHLSDDFRPEPDGLMPDLTFRQGLLAAAGTPAEEAAAQRLLDRYEADAFNFRAHRWSIQNATIPQIQMNLDRIVNSVVTMINDALTGYLRCDKVAEQDYPLNPEGFVFVQRDDEGNLVLDSAGNIIRLFPYDQYNNEHGMPLFIRSSDQNAANIYWPLNVTPNPADPNFAPENPNNLRSIMTINNIQINPVFLDPNLGTYNLLALSLGGAESDNRVVLALMESWQSNDGPYAVRTGTADGNYRNVQDAYIRMVGEIATTISEANGRVRSSTIQVQQAENMRNAIKGVSMDEELNSMLRFQFAFQAASRVFNLIDGMIDQVVNRTGRAGL